MSDNPNETHGLTSGYAPLSYFRFYHRDYMSSQAMGVLSFAAKGMFLELICHQFETGFIPLETEKIRRLIGADKEEFAAVWPELEDEFQVQNGVRINSKMAQVRIECSRQWEANKANGAKGGRPKKETQTKPNENPRVMNGLTQTKPKDNPTANPNKRHTDTDTDTEQSSSLRSEEITEESLRSSSVSPKPKKSDVTLAIPDPECDDPLALWLLAEMRKKPKWRPGIDAAKVFAKVDQWRSECDGDMDWLRDQLEQALGHVAASKNTSGLSYLGNWVRRGLQGNQGPRKGNSQMRTGGKPSILDPYIEAMKQINAEKKQKLELFEVAI